MAIANRDQNRLWGNTEQVGDCQLWLGATWDDGYGKISWEGKHWRIHRLAYTLKKGPIPRGMQIRHACDRPLCIAEDHLVPGTPAQNMGDKVLRGRQSRGLAHSAACRPVRGEAHHNYGHRGQFT